MSDSDSKPQLPAAGPTEGGGGSDQAAPNLSSATAQPVDAASVVAAPAAASTPAPAPAPTPIPAPAPAASAKAEGGLWERQVLERLAFAALAEQRRSRRWGIFFKMLAFGYVLFALVIGYLHAQGGLAGASAKAGKHTALIEVRGVIAARSEAGADQINTALRAAFEDRNTAGVVVRINSPGGSPVQAGLIHDEIKRLRQEHPATPVYAVVEDVCASGGYYIAAAADRIYVDKASIVGSIGVIMDGFGFTGAMEKLGIERRVMTAGENKAILDPFSPVDPRHRQHAQAMLNEVHQQFIKIVKDGRGSRLKDNPEIFSGLFWTGARAIELGLADAVGSMEQIARDEFKADKVVDFTERESITERLARRFGAAVGESGAKVLIQRDADLPSLR